VFHAVGPVYSGGRRNEADLLASCYRKCFELAEEHNASSISFPSISTGAYGYPLREAAGIAMREVTLQLERADGCVLEAIFVLFDRKTYEIHVQALAELTRQQPG
jgi:O-acetyl-ADP-ribose deacetylase (regulator of RNase III)